MAEISMVEAVARAIVAAPNPFVEGTDQEPNHCALEQARAAIEAVRNHNFGDSFIIRHGSEPTAILKGDVPHLVLRHLIDLAMAEGAALAAPDEGRET